MRISSLKIKNIFIAFVVALIATPALADENVISSVVISKAKDNPNAYELSIDSTQQVPYKNHVDEDGNVYFDLKNSTLAKNLGTIYDDVSNIDNVTVKQLDKNKVRIYVNGKDAQNTELVFVNSLFEIKEDTSKKVIINRPISEYKSTTYNDDLEYADDSQEWDDNSFNFYHLSSSILSELKNGPSGKILILLTLFVIVSILIKTLMNKVAQDKEPLIGLNNSKYLNDNVQIGSLGKNITIQKEENKNNSNRQEALRQAQKELTKAHQKYQEYIQNKYQSAQIKTIDKDLLKKSFALNQYQKSTQNPYKDQEVIRINKGFSTDIQSNGNFQIPPRPKMQPKKEFTSPYIKRTNNFVQQGTKNNQPKQNMKFLESVTKIYEQSGRRDLADELKNSITKAKQTI